jgi:hypothetical protein
MQLNRGGVQAKVRDAVYIVEGGGLSITKLTNALALRGLRLLPDCVYDTASLPFYL